MRANTGSQGGKAARLVLVLGVAMAMLAGLPASRAFADPGHGEHGRGGDEHRRGNPHRHMRERGPEVRYAQPVYVPAPEYYQPPPSPGISLFLPLDLRR